MYVAVVTYMQIDAHVLLSNAIVLIYSTHPYFIPDEGSAEAKTRWRYVNVNKKCKT